MEKDDKQLSIYDQLKSQDIVHWCAQLLDNGGWTWRYTDGKMVAQIQPGISSTPWHHVKSDYRLQCGIWHQIMFDMVGPRLPNGKKFVPSKCQQCFKVVVRPKTLRQLFQLVRLQKRMDIPSKSGIEIRSTTHSNYGGYFYNVGLQEGLETYEKVRKAIDECVNEDVVDGMGPHTEVLLKRACTEYEHACGDSDTWQITEYQLHVEALVERFVIVENKEVRQPEVLINHVHKKWIDFAFERNDKTYLDYTNGKPLYPKYKTFHHLLKEYRKNGIEGITFEGIYDSTTNNSKLPGNSGREAIDKGNRNRPTGTEGPAKRDTKGRFKKGSGKGNKA